MRRLPVWLPPALFTLAVTVTGLGSAQLWRDELAHVECCHPVARRPARLAGTIDAATGPYYLCMHVWVEGLRRLHGCPARAGGAGDDSRRRAARRRSGHGSSIGAAASSPGCCSRCSPHLSVRAGGPPVRAGHHARGARHTAAGDGAARRPRWARWAGYAAAVAALGLIHLIALTLLAAHALVVLIAWWRGPAAAGVATPAQPDAERDRRVWRWLVAVVPVALLAGPLLVKARTQQSRQLNWVHLARLDDLTALPGGVTQSSVVGGLLVGVAALGAARLGRRALLPVGAVLLPVLLLFAAGTVVPLWVPRYLVFVVPFACLLAGAALAAVAAPAALVVVVLAGLLGLPDQAALRRTHEWPRSAPVDYAGAARVIADGQRPGDAVVYSPRHSWLFLDLGIEYHLGDPPRDVLVTEDEVRRGDLWAAECPRAGAVPGRYDHGCGSSSPAGTPSRWPPCPAPRATRCARTSPSPRSGSAPA